jgi:hypothetical protein
MTNHALARRSPDFRKILRVRLRIVDGLLSVLSVRYLSIEYVLLLALTQY